MYSTSGDDTNREEFSGADLYFASNAFGVGYECSLQNLLNF